MSPVLVVSLIFLVIGANIAMFATALSATSDSAPETLPE